jgi:hypothetical protein
MKKIVLALLLPVLSVNAGTLDVLKNTPASKYEVGKIQLELMTYMFNEKLTDERVKGTDFKFNKFVVEEESDKLFIKMSLVGRARDLTSETCEKISELTNSILPKDKLMKDIWTELSKKEYESLSKQFLLKTELVSKENESFKVDC